uniref:Transmembrane protein 218 n=1 Tax=Tetranychus urticae TaxID=32264 RepID=T1JUD9_TETUR
MRILGIGSGLFLLCLLWSISIFVWLLTGRAKAPYTSLGPLILLVSTCITTFLLLIPRSPVDEKLVDYPENGKSFFLTQITDWMHFWRILIIFVNVIAAIAGSTKC